ncbi:hypothetical protein BDW66DRAFT_137087 [Aspergillus desertorum]
MGMSILSPLSLRGKNGVKCSNGNQASRQSGRSYRVVPMDMEDARIPINLNFAGKAYEHSKLLEYAYVFKQGQSTAR